MGRPIHRFSATEVDRFAKRKGTFHDGGGLYLRSDGKRQCSWLFRYEIDGKPRLMGIGPYPVVTLAAAREKAESLRRVVKVDGKDPMAERDATRAAVRLEAAKAITFKECAEKYIAAHRAGWRNEKHAAQWSATLATYANPVIGDLPAQAVDVGLVLKVLEPIWTEKPETANRLRGRIESILDYAKARGWREGENPARWRGHLDNLLAPRAKVRAVEHHAAMPYADLPAFMKMLREQEGIAASALEFLILTASRTSEAIGARWSEVGAVDKAWTVPATRMKARREHRVPLSPQAFAILDVMPGTDDGANDGFVFPGAKPGKPLSNMALLMLLRRMGHGELTAHGFRATFKTWASERTRFQADVVEASLAHVVGGKVEQAYMRGDLFEKRRELMTAWADYCSSH